MCPATVAVLPLLLPLHACTRRHNACRLHAKGIQVILDVVYNHTAELDDKHPYTISMR